MSLTTGRRKANLTEQLNGFRWEVITYRIDKPESLKRKGLDMRLVIQACSS
jgi:hypothetical protein